jgi:NAD(P)-dependent dehydrogenase (short-subunit alcohol dehydrogenase family)
VAGGTGGLGQAISLALLEEAANVIVTYRHQQEFAGLKLAAGRHQSPIEGYEADVTAESAAHELIEAVVRTHSRIDILVNSVGVPED